MIKAIVFDCFGVLVGGGFENTYKAAGGDPKSDRKFIEATLTQASLGQISDQELHKAMANKLGLNTDEWYSSVISSEQPNIRLLEYIAKLHQDYKIGLLSNASSGVINKKLGDNRLAEYFDVIVVSADVGLVKPDEEIYKIIIERLDVLASECVFIDDHKTFLEPAGKLGMQTILFEDTNQVISELEALLQS